jgi:ribonuclease HI
LISPTGEQLKYVLQIFWKVSNNKAEYEALLHGLRLAASMGIKRLLVYGDSAKVINQVNKSWDRNEENMDAYCLEVCKLENKFYGLEFHYVVRDNNVTADVLSKLGSTRAQVPAGVFIHELHVPSIPEPAPPTTDPAHPPAGQEVMMIDVDWRQPFIDYLSEQKVPSDKNLAEQLIHRAKSYVSRKQDLQAGGIFWSTPEVRSPRRRQGHLGGDSQRLPHRIIPDLGSNFNNHQFWEYCENSGIDVRYVSVAHPRAKEWCSTLSRSAYTTLPTPKEASGSRNYPMRSEGYVLNPPSRRDNRHTSWSTAPKQSSLLTSCGTHW